MRGPRRSSWPPPNHEALAGFLAAQNQGLPITQPLISNQRIGSFWCTVVSVPISGGLFGHELGRVPSAVIVVDNYSANVIYRTAADHALATPSQIFLRSGPSATVAMVLIG